MAAFICVNVCITFLVYINLTRNREMYREDYEVFEGDLAAKSKDKGEKR